MRSFRIRSHDTQLIQVKEALWVLQELLAQLGPQHKQPLRIVVGAGNHSNGPVARIKSAVERLLTIQGHTLRAISPGELECTLCQTYLLLVLCMHGSWNMTIILFCYLNPQ